MSHRSRSLLAMATALSMAASVAAQQPAELGSSTGTASSVVVEVPYRLINNHLILPLSINGSEPLDIALDTGMPAAGLALYDHPRNADLGLDINPAMTAQVGGAGGSGQRFEARIAMSEKLSLPGLELQERVIVMPAMPGLSGYHDGIIGYSFFGNFVVELDSDRKLLRLHDPESYQAPPDAVVVPLAFEGRLPHITVGLDIAGTKPFEAKVVVDLGASHPISLNRDESDEIVLPATSLSTLIGRGISGPMRGEVGRIASLRLGTLELRDVVTTFPVSEHQNPRGVDSLAGNLGNDVLRRFNTTFDYSHNRMLLMPSRSTDEPFHFDRSGLRIGLGEKLVVEAVIEGSPAEDSGIEVGDFLTHVNGEPVSVKQYGEVRTTFLGTGEVRLTLQRGEATFDKTIRLRSLI